MDDDRDCLAVRVTTATGPVQVRVFPTRTEGGARRPVLFGCHGWTDSGEVFGPLAEALGRRWTVVAPDAPGHGGTPWPPAPRLVIADHAPGALAVLDRLPELHGRRSSVVLHGHSMGALTAARLAAARPGIVRHLVLEDPARSTPRRSPSSPQMRVWLRRLQRSDHADRVAQLKESNPDWPPDESGAWARSKIETDARQLDVPADWGEPLMALLSDVACPVTIIRGDPGRGGHVSATAARRCAAACPGGAEVIALPAGHNPRREARTQFVAALAAVLGRYET